MTAEKINAWNAAFLRSFFTHPNSKGKLVRYRGGAYAFWRDMLDGKFKPFPSACWWMPKLRLDDC